jgi:anti-sigma regulatory factor (Ser/Thr protein kinase)
VTLPQGAAVRHVTEVFARDAVEVGRARAFVRSALGAWGLADQIPVLELGVSELVTNAVVHGAGGIEVCLTLRGDVVHLSVADEGGGTPRIDRRAEAGDAGGWGLRLVDRMSDAWGTSSGPHATRVWMERHVRPPRN